MSSGPNGERLFRIIFSKAIGDALRRFQRRATRQGRGERFLAAVRYVVNRLHRDPTEFGEPLYRLPAIRVQIRCAVVDLFGIHFGVYEDRPIVFIKEVKLLS